MLRLYVRNRTGTRVLLAQCEQPFNLGIVKLGDRIFRIQSLNNATTLSAKDWQRAS